MVGGAESTWSFHTAAMSLPVLSRALVLVLVVVLTCACVCRADRYHPERVRTSETRDGGGGGGARIVAPIDPAERAAEYWVSNAQARISERLRRRENLHTARNVVMFLGDGMSVPTLTAARTLLGQRNNRTGEEAQLSFENFPTAGLVKTYCLNGQIADSACTATAYLCGVKVNRGIIGLGPHVQRHDCSAAGDPDNHLQSIATWALADGRDAGIVTTTRVTHASPAGAYAHTGNRGWENDAELQAECDVTLQEDIAMQLIHDEPGRQFKVILGGGRREFLPNTDRDEEGTRGSREDGRYLIEEWQADKSARNLSHAYVWNRSQLMSVAQSPPEYLLGLFEGSHMQYNMQADPETEPTLAELTEVAITSLRRNENGFFLFVEGGRIDHAHHDNYVELALDETIEFAAAVQRATELLSEEDSLIVVTADHAHVMAYNGYTHRGGDVLGPSDDVDEHGVPYLTLSYTNGPGFRTQEDGRRVNVLLDEDYRDLEWYAHVEVPLDSETHGGDDVAVFALGPQHQLFTGLYEQNELPHLMAYAACIGPGHHACHSAASPHRRPLLATLLLTLLFSYLRS